MNLIQEGGGSRGLGVGLPPLPCSWGLWGCGAGVFGDVQLGSLGIFGDGRRGSLGISGAVRLAASSQCSVGVFSLPAIQESRFSPCLPLLLSPALAETFLQGSQMDFLPLRWDGVPGAVPFPWLVLHWVMGKGRAWAQKWGFGGVWGEGTSGFCLQKSLSKGKAGPVSSELGCSGTRGK